MHRINPRRTVGLFLSFLVSLVILFYAHEGLEAERALGKDRSLLVMGAYGLLGIVGLLVSPSIRDRVVPAATTVGVLYRRFGRRSTDVKAVVAPDSADVDQ